MSKVIYIIYMYYCQRCLYTACKTPIFYVAPSGPVLPETDGEVTEGGASLTAGLAPVQVKEAEPGEGN